MENRYSYVIVGSKANKATQEGMEMLIEMLAQGNTIVSATATSEHAHYILYLPYTYDEANAPDEDHELDEEDLKVIEDNIDIAMKDIKKRNG